MVRVARIETTGGPEVIRFHDVDLPAPGAGEVRVRNTAVGLNFIDTYHRRGIYPVTLPAELGVEGVGVVEAVGDGVTGFTPGQRVGYFGPERGAYATHRRITAASLFPLPDDIDDETAAAALLKGCTAEFLVERCAKVEPGWPVLVHAAAGGVGLILVQWLKAVGATVIGTVSTEDKAATARAAGADHIVFYRNEDTAARVRELTGGAGVRVVFDGVGMSTWESSLDSCGIRGLIVNYGNADAPVGGVNLGILALKGSLYNSRPMLYHYYAEPEERAAGVARLWEMLRSGKVKITIGQRYRLEDVAQAHIDLEGRRTTGSTLLLP
ncbi:quinone oxidoreductase [Sphingobium jiangsuense]|uniref:NADPH2:quinone reductase n=1 Tax=Sphingobium jiangsuense TaxID=870476 RepID=A0A7W6BE66_9SPHN|nr:quinone oxidoreductase [Sphingobium jiangsuense]MBB3925173.1 NADPH2:quinone reductase [Sphingobium jiangsuense]GLT01319.1 quinone oxidoreductase [Sphingobium jiangsuense]